MNRSPKPVYGKSMNIDNFCATSAFLVTYVVKLSTSRLLARNNFRVARKPLTTTLNVWKPFQEADILGEIRIWKNQPTDRLVE